MLHKVLDAVGGKIKKSSCFIQTQARQTVVKMFPFWPLCNSPPVYNYRIASAAVVLVQCKTWGLLENTQVLECLRNPFEFNLQTAHVCCDLTMILFAFKAIERIRWWELLLSAHILLLLFFFFFFKATGCTDARWGCRVYVVRKVDQVNRNPLMTMQEEKLQNINYSSKVVELPYACYFII